MNFFDANCFLGKPYSGVLRSFSTPAHLLAEMDDLGIERAVVCDAEAQTPGAPANKKLKRRLGRSGRLWPCWILHPNHLATAAAIKERLDELKSEGIRMVRMQPGAVNNYSLHHWAFGEFFAGLSAEGIILFIDLLNHPGFGGAPIPATEWSGLHSLASNFPALRIIFSSRKLSQTPYLVMGLLRACPNVHLELSAFQFWRATEAICADSSPAQLVFGSAMPFFDAGQGMVQLRLAQIGKEAKALVAGGNLATMLGITETTGNRGKK